MSPPLDLFSGVVPFVVAAECGSIRGAAEQLGVTPSAVTRAVQRLEQRLGVRLMVRSPRSVRTTDEGKTVLECYRDAVTRALAAQDFALSAQRRPQGILRASASRILGRELIAPALPQLFDRYPGLELRISFTDRVVGLVQENVDVAVRIGDLDDSDGRRWVLAGTRWVTVASPAYLARAKAPKTPRALDEHACLRFLAPDGRPRDWTYRRGDETTVVAVRGSLVTDDGAALVAAAEAGAGLVQAMDFMVTRALQDGRLVEVLEGDSCPGPTISAVAAPGRHRSPRVRAFVTFLQETFERAGLSRS
ncbi:MAG: LysR family transcriptional regulator [Myxococcales bacterium]|nr:LysR family transcriptional regulator [Myxococcales bacterium]MCB9650947.1 LysR family transcriptional regulator [Deltaproteobacteria bacterium]